MFNITVGKKVRNGAGTLSIRPGDRVYPGGSVLAGSVKFNITTDGSEVIANHPSVRFIQYGGWHVAVGLPELGDGSDLVFICRKKRVDVDKWRPYRHIPPETYKIKEKPEGYRVIKKRPIMDRILLEMKNLKKILKQHHDRKDALTELADLKNTIAALKSRLDTLEHGEHDEHGEHIES